MLRIGLSYDEGTPEYALYALTLIDAGSRFGFGVEPVWLAGRDKVFKPNALDDLAAVVLTGGADVGPQHYGFADGGGVCRSIPDRDEAEFPLVRAVLKSALPVFAICRGMQLLNVASGGTLIPDLPGHDGPGDSARHKVSLTPGSFLAARVVGQREGNVSSAHHQAVDGPGTDLCVAGTSDDGTVEAIEWAIPESKAWLVAVQWHPERMSLDEPLSGTLYSAFLRAAAS